MNWLALRVLAVLSWIGVVSSALVLSIPCVIFGVTDPSGAATHRVIAFWCRIVLFCVRARVRVDGWENVATNRVYILACNHEGIGDIPVLYVTLPMQYKFVAKRMLFNIPIFGLDMRCARHIPIDRGQGPEKTRTAFSLMAKAIENGFSVLMFPEGSRTRDGNLRPFKSGTFRLALDTKTPILPVALAGSREGLPADDWVVRGGMAVLKIGKPIEVAGLDNTDENVDWLRDRCRDEILALRHEAHIIREAWAYTPALADVK